MKTYCLLFVVLLNVLGLAAQNAVAPNAAVSPAANTSQNATDAATDTNREAITRRLLERMYRGETNLVGPPPGTPTAATPTAATPQPTPGQPAAVPPTTTPQPTAVQPAVTTAVPTTPGAPGAGVPVAPAGVPAGAVAPQAAPGVPGVAGAVAPPPVAANVETNAAGKSMDEVFPPGLLKVQNMDLDQALDYYASELVGRTILRPANLPAAKITLTSQTRLTRREAIQAMDAVFALNGITTLNVGEKFVTVVPEASAVQQAKAFSELSKDQLPELGQYTTHVVQLKYVQVQDVQQAITPFAKSPASIIAIPNNNIIIMRDYAPNVKRMLELIEKIDVYIPADYEPVVIPIRYALAADIQQVLASLSPSGAGVSVGRSAQPGQTGTRGLQGLPGSTPGLGTQGAINPATGQPYPGGAGGTGALGSRGGFQNRLQQAVQRITSGAMAGDIQIIGQAKIIADERTNSLLIFASKSDVEAIRKVIDKLDVVLAQVLIEALIVEVSLDDSSEYGVSYLQRPQTSGKFTGAGVLRNNTPGDDPTSITSLSSNLLSGFSYFGKWGNDFSFVVRAAAMDNRIQVLQRPRIQTSHAVPCNLFVGETRPYPSTSYYGGGAFGGYSTIQQLQIGVTLQVTPLINPDGLVVMDIGSTITDSSGTVNLPNVGDVPITKNREANAKVAVRDRETVVLGGFISNNRTDGKSGVPFLKDLPLLGALFRSSSRKAERRELMIFIRPTVLPTPESAAVAATAENDRLPAIKRAQLESEKYTREQEEKLRQWEEKNQKR